MRFRPSNYTSLKQPFKMQLQIENEDVTWSPQYNLPVTRTNKRRALSSQEVELDGWFLIFTLYCKHVPYNSCTTLTWVLYFTPIFLDWRLEFEQALQLKGCNLWTLHNETQMRASILNTGSKCANRVVLTLKGQCKPHGLGIMLGGSCSKLLLHCTKWDF